MLANPGADGIDEDLNSTDRGEDDRYTGGDPDKSLTSLRYFPSFVFLPQLNNYNSKTLPCLYLSYSLQSPALKKSPILSEFCHRLVKVHAKVNAAENLCLQLSVYLINKHPVEGANVTINPAGFILKPGVHMICNGRRPSAMDELQIPHRSVWSTTIADRYRSYGNQA